jgi:hypothetical protein
MSSQRICRKIGIAVAACIILCIGGLAVLRWQIQSGLDRWCTVAQAAHPHPGDDVVSLLDYVQSDSHTFQDRNYAVWALGQARDSRALPVLEAHFTGEQCHHETNLCQHELEKAIKLCKVETPNLLCIQIP